MDPGNCKIVNKSLPNKWNSKYASGEASDKGPDKLVVGSVRALHPGRALDLACGLGRHALYLASTGWQVTAIDSSEVAIDILMERAIEGLLVNAICADLEADTFAIEENHWDLIVDCCYLQHSLFGRIRNGIRSGGHFIGVFPMTGINPQYCMRPGEGRELFGDWKLIHYSEGERTEIFAEKP